jgi:hypothetical protein
MHGRVERDAGPSRPDGGARSTRSTQRAPLRDAGLRSVVDSAPDPHALLVLQRAIGNAAVQRLLERAVTSAAAASPGGLGPARPAAHGITTGPPIVQRHALSIDYAAEPVSTVSSEIVAVKADRDWKMRVALEEKGTQRFLEAFRQFLAAARRSAVGHTSSGGPQGGSGASSSAVRGVDR